MSISIEIEDGKLGTKNTAAVSSRGQLVVGPIGFSTPTYREMTATATAYNFYAPKANKQFVITDILINTDKNVSSTNGATVVIYTAGSATTTTATDDILTTNLLKNDKETITKLNWLINSGVWINAYTDDATVNLTIAGYYVDKV